LLQSSRYLHGVAQWSGVGLFYILAPLLFYGRKCVGRAEERYCHDPDRVGAAPPRDLGAHAGRLLGEEEEKGGEEEEKGGGETTSAGGETTGTGEETTTTVLAATTLELTQSRDTGVVGNANLTDTPGGVEVAVAVEGLLTTPGTPHVAHIHEGGTCADDRADNGAAVQYPLDPLISLEDGTASSATSIEGVTLEQLTSGAPKYVNVHAEPTGVGVPPGIACADLPGTGGEENVPAQNAPAQDVPAESPS
jgi:hypothetical protein